MGEDAANGSGIMGKPIFYEGREIAPLTPEDRKDVGTLRKYAEKNGFDFIYRCPLDITGAAQGFAHPINYALQKEKVLGFDGSSLVGFQAIDESDMRTEWLLETAIVDTSVERPKLRILARVRDPVTKDWYDRDPINIAMKAEEYLKGTGVADIANFGPEAEFFIFDGVYAEVKENEAMYRFDSREAWWNGAMKGGHVILKKKGYSPLPPQDTLEDLREDIMSALLFNGFPVETGHHEVATAGQGEIDMKYAGLVSMANQLVWYKHILKNVAEKHGKVATFLPKALLGDNGSGMHVHQSLWKGETPLFAGDKHGGLSQEALWYIGGILEHAAAVCAITNPTTLSYKRIVPHCEAPTNLVYSARNRSAAIRIPQYEPGVGYATRIEVRFPDPMASGHLAFAAMLMAGLDGIENKLDPGDPFEGNVYESSGGLKTLPRSLDEALDALEKDNDFLTKGNVFTGSFLREWVRLKREEAQKVQMHINPVEVAMYLSG